MRPTKRGDELWEHYYWSFWYYYWSARCRHGPIVPGGAIILAAVWVWCLSLSLSCYWWGELPYRWGKVSSHQFWPHLWVVITLKGLAKRLALFTLKHFMLGENTGRKRKTGDRFTGARLPFGVSSNLSYHCSYQRWAFPLLRCLWPRSH